MEQAITLLRDITYLCEFIHALLLSVGRIWISSSTQLAFILLRKLRTHIKNKGPRYPEPLKVTCFPIYFIYPPKKFYKFTDYKFFLS